jgi:hypothetical protein
MEWWNSFLEWFNSSDGRYVVSSLVLPALAIIVAGLLAAWIASGSVKRLLAKHDRELKVAAIASLIDAAEQASVWNSLTPQEQVLSDRAVGQADIQVRLLPIKGADVAANWAGQSLAQMRRNSATFGYQVEPAVVEFRDRLVEWQQRPGRSKRFFQNDLERWAVEGTENERRLATQQDEWVAQQHHEQFASPEQSLRPATPQRAMAMATTAAAQPLAETQAFAPPQSPSEPSTATEATRIQTQRVLENVEAVERQREETDENGAYVPPPIHAFPPRKEHETE